MKNLTPVTREEKLLHAIAIQEPADITPVTGEEKFLAALASGEAPNKEPKTRKEYFLNECANSTGGGGGDFTTCVLKTTGAFDQETDDRRVNIAHVVSFDEDAFSQGSTSLPIGDNELTVVLYKGKAYMDFVNENNPLRLDVVSGGAEPDIDGFSFYITGDCVFKKRTS